MSRAPAMRVPALKILLALIVPASTVALLACAMETLDVGSVGSPFVDGGAPLARDDAGPPVTREEAVRLCQEDSDANVVFEQRCSGDGRASTPWQLEQCAETLLLPGVTPSVVDALRECIARKHADGCDVDLPGSCLYGLRGSLPVGARCSAPVQCATGLCSGANVLFPRCGTCVAPLGAGSSCVQGDDCVAGFHCSAAWCGSSPCESVGTCVPDAPDAGCEAGAFCGTLTYCKSGACVPRAAVGEPCNSPDECQWSLDCDSTTHVCVSIPTAGPREDCSSDGGGPSKRCSVGLLPQCPGLDDGTQRCHVWLKEGQGCDESAGPGSLERCDFGLRCMQGRCRLDFPTCE